MVARRYPIKTPYGAQPEQHAEAAVRDLKARLRALREAAAKNEVILRKTQERELELLRAESIADLLRVLVGGLGESYALDAVTLVLLDSQHEIRHLLIGGGERLEDFPDVAYVDSFENLGSDLAILGKPWLGSFSAAAHARLFPRARGLRTVAIIPLWRQKRLTGLLNFGSADGRRFTRHHGTDFLSHLGIIAAVCVENAVNRARLLRSGLTDFLTGWHNRRYLHTRIKEELSRAQRHGSSVACLMIDVDYFKQINDARGHLAGDEILRELARRIDAETRASDTAARFGGDEFALLLPEATQADAVHLAERILHSACTKPVDLGALGSERLSISIGVAALKPQRDERDLLAVADRLLAQADAALYKAKTAGRGRVAVADQGPSSPGAGGASTRETAARRSAR
jgi:two-component system cell cycle response regulator